MVPEGRGSSGTLVPDPSDSDVPGIRPARGKFWPIVFETLAATKKETSDCVKHYNTSLKHV